MGLCSALGRRVRILAFAACALSAPAWADPNNPLSLSQANGDLGGLDGGVTSEGREIRLTASSSSLSCNYSPYHLEFEVRPTASSFTGAVTHYSVTMNKTCVLQQYPWTHITGLLENTAYKWRVREVAGPGYTSSFVSFNGGATAFTTGPLPANHLSFTSSALTPTAGNCAGPSTVQLQNAVNAPVPVGATSNVPVFQAPTVLPWVSFYSDSACDAGVTATSMPAGTSNASFYWKSTRSGSVTVGADVAGGLWALQSHSVNAGPPNRLAFVSGNYNEFLNKCSNPRTVQLQDVYGNAALATVATPVTVSSSIGTTQFYSDATCATPATTVTIPVGASQVNFHFKDTTLGGKTVYASSSYPQISETNYTYGYTSIVTPAQTRDAGQCSLLTTLQTQDGNLQPFPAPVGQAIFFTGSPGMSYYSESTCDAGISSVTMDGGTANVDFYWRSTLASSPYNGQGYTVYLYGYGGYFGYANSQTEQINPGPPYRLAFGNNPQTIVAGNCSPSASARSLDFYSNYSPAPANIAVGLTSTSDAGRFYSDSLCATQIGTTTIATGALLQNFWWRDTQPGSPTLTLSSSAPVLVTANQTETVLPRLVFTSPAQNIVAGTCATSTVQSQDGNGAAWNTATSKSINLSTNSPAGPFFSDSACTVSISTITMAAGTNTVTFYWKDTRSGTHTITASASGYSSGSQAQTIRADVPAMMAFTTAPQVVGAGSCSGTTTVAQQDQYGNAATQATARTASLSSTSATTRFYPTNACTAGGEITSLSIASGLSAASFWWKDTVAPQTPTLTAASSGILDGTQVETVSVGAANRLAITSAPQTVTAGACSGAATVGSQDASGNASNVSTATSVSLSSSGTAVFYAGAGCSGAPVTSVSISAGTNNATFSWVETTAGTLTITPSAAGFTGTGQAQTVTPAPGTQLAFTSAAQSIAAGACSGATTVALTDQYDNPTPAAAAIAVALTTTSGTLSFYSDAGCSTQVTSLSIAAGTSTITLYFRDVFTGTPTLTATASGLIPDSQTQNIGGRDQATFRWYSSAGAALGAEGAAIQAAPGTQLHLRVGVKAVAFAWRLASGDADPISETFANAENNTGSYLNVGAADGSLETLTETRIGNGQNRYWSLGDPTAGGWTFHIYSFNSLPAGKTSYPLCLTARTTGEALQVGYTFTSTPSFTPTFPAGWQITSVSLTEVCFDLKLQGFNGGPLTVYLQDALRGAGTDLTTDTFTLDQVTVKGDPPTYLALERSTTSTFTTVTQVLSGELWDDASYSNGSTVAPVLSGTNANEIRMESRPSIPTGQVDVNPGGQGEWDFTLTMPSGGGSQYYRMVVTNSLGTKLSNLEVTSVPAQVDTAATRLAFVSLALSVPAGTCAGPLQVQAQDPVGNARIQASARTVTLSSSPGAGQFYSNASCSGAITSTTISAGSSDATFYWRDTTAGSPVITAASTGLTSATQTETVTAGPPASVAFTSAAQNVTVGACSAAATVQVRDAYGNPSPASAGGVAGTLGSTSGTTTFYSNSSCSAAITSLTVAAGSTTGTFWFRDTTAGSPTISWATALGTASQVETFSVGLPTQLAITSSGFTLTAGNCSSSAQAGGVVVQAQDSFGNPANVTANIVVGLASDSPSTTFYTDAACSAVNQVTTRTIVAPANTMTFYWRDTTARTVNVTVTAAGLAPGLRGYTVVPAAAARLATATAPQTVVAGACSSAVTVNVQDTYGNATSIGSSANLPLASSDAPVMGFFSDASCGTGVSFLTLISTDQSKQFWFRDTRAGSPVITVSGPGLNPVTQGETIVPAPTSGLTMSVPASITAGATAAITVSAVDPYVNVAQDYAGSVQFSTSDPRAVLPPATSFTPGTGTQNFNATFFTAGTQSLTVTDNGAPPLSTTLSGLIVRPAGAASLQVSGLPSPITSGSAHDVTVGAADPYGNLATAYLGTVRFTSTDATGTMPADYAFTAGDQGRRTFTSSVTLRAPGTHTVTATDTVTGTVTGQQSGIVVLQAQGGPCTGDGECSTSYCVGSVCCNTSCAGACNSCVLPNRVGTCSVVPDGVLCPNSLYCDGVETCQAGFCSQGAAVSCVDRQGYDQYACDEPAKGCVLVPNAAPLIVHDASPRAATGIPYAYNAFGRVTGLGARPMTFGTCASLPGFQVDRLTGAVAWTPAAAGTYTACVTAQNSAGQDQYTFQVTVTVPSGGPPIAVFTVTPDTGEAPLAAAFDGSASTGDASALPLLWRWDFGDYSPLAGDPQTSNQYLVAGGYQAELTAFDAAGRPGTVKHPLWVLDQGRRPPSAKILANALTGDGTLSTNFACDCQVGDAALRGFFWELGDLATAATSTVTQSFPPGRYRVRLTVVDGNGLTATDSVEVAVTNGSLQPPECRVGLSPPAGAAPLTVVHHATFGDQDGSVVSLAMTYGDGLIGVQPDQRRVYDTPGRYRSKLKVTDDSGLTCVDLVQVSVVGPTGRPPPGFLSSPVVAGTCGLTYQYSGLGRPLVSGSGPFQFSLVPVAGGSVPDGMRVEPDTGEVLWTPSSKNTGLNQVVLRATSPDGTADQPLDVTITCAEQQNLSLGCTCSQTGGASWIAIGAGLLLLARLKRRREGLGYSPTFARRRRLPR